MVIEPASLRWRLLAVFLGLLSLAAALPSAAEAQLNDRDQALALFQRAEDHFRAGEFERAVFLLEEAIELHDAAPMHFNLARALREMDDPEGARNEYAIFQEMEPDSPRAAEVAVRIEEIDREIAARENAPDEAVPIDLPPDELPPRINDPTPDTPTADSSSGSLAPWILGGAAVLPLAAGVVTGLMHNSEVESARTAVDQKAANEHIESADTLALVTNIGFALAGALAVTAIVWGLIELLSDDGSADAELDFSTLGRF